MKMSDESSISLGAEVKAFRIFGYFSSVLDFTILLVRNGGVFFMEVLQSNHIQSILKIFCFQLFFQYDMYLGYKILVRVNISPGYIFDLIEYSRSRSLCCYSICGNSMYIACVQQVCSFQQNLISTPKLQVYRSLSNIGIDDSISSLFLSAV